MEDKKSGPPVFRIGMTGQTALGLLLGIGLGTLAQAARSPGLETAIGSLEPLGQLWINGLQMVILPLVVTQLAAGILLSSRRGLNRMMLGSLSLFLLLLCLAALVGISVAAPLLNFLPPNAPTLSSLSAPPEFSVQTQAISAKDWLIGLIPRNIFESAINEDLLQIALFTILLSLACNQLSSEVSEPIRTLTGDLRDAVFLIVHWLMRLSPLGMFALSLTYTRRIGLEMVGLLSFYVVIVVAAVLVALALLYPLTVFGASVGWRQFAKAVLPGQLLAIGTRSSLATVPALMDGARAHLSVPDPLLEFSIPLAASSLKLNQLIVGGCRFLFLTRIFGIDVELPQLLVFMLTIFFLSFSSAGIPSSGPGKTLPAYSMAGIPIEGVMLLTAIDFLPDIFETVLNSTGYLTVTLLLARWVETPANQPVAGGGVS